MKVVNLNAGIGMHSVAWADAMFQILGKDFVFLEFGRKGDGQYGSYRKATKGVDYYTSRPYIAKMKDDEHKAFRLINDADVLITAGEPLALTHERLCQKKLTFRQAERIFKTPLLKNPFRLYRLYSQYIRYTNPNYRKLCLSGFDANDMAYCGSSYHNKCYKFAYFTQIPQLEINDVISSRRKDKMQLVWCARFIGWKHPELPLKLAEELIASDRGNFEIKMIGADTMPLWHKIKSEVEKRGLHDHVILTGGMPNTEVLEQMRKSHIFIFTSDRGEGWGAVLNEAMGAGCACVASHEIGSVPFLLKNNENGMIFRSCSVDSLHEKVAYLYDNPEECVKLGKNAYQTITTEWSAHNAAERLVKLSESILAGHEISFDDGPCSKAYPINSNDLILR